MALKDYVFQTERKNIFFAQCPQPHHHLLLKKKPETTAPPPATIHTWEPPLKAPYETLPPDDRNRLRQIYVILPNESLLNFMRPPLTSPIQRSAANAFHLTRS